MQKNLVAAAVASALGAPGIALAQASMVQVSGTIDLNMATPTKAGAQTDPATTAITRMCGCWVCATVSKFSSLG